MKKLILAGSAVLLSGLLLSAAPAGAGSGWFLMRPPMIFNDDPHEDWTFTFDTHAPLSRWTRNKWGVDSLHHGAVVGS